MLLYGDKVKLRPVEDLQDIEDLFGWWNNPREVGDFLPISITDRFSFAEMMTKTTRESIKLTVFVIWTNGGEKKRIGYICSYKTHPFSDVIEIRFAVDSKERNKGYATEAVRLMTEFLFATKQKIEKIQTLSIKGNDESQRALERNNYKKEAELRKHFFINGEHRDVVLHSILRDEWKRVTGINA